MIKKLAIGVIILIGLTPALATTNDVFADSPPSAPIKQVRVEITDEAWKDFVLEVGQGQLVELTFVWAHKGYVNEEHIIVLQGYQLEWDKIDINHREATVKFIADKPGTFTFKCDLKCDLHDYLQNAHLKVQSGSNSGATIARTPTKLSLDPSAWSTNGKNVLLTAGLKDEKGVPIPKATLRFLVDAEFLGKQGKMEIGVAKTDENGIAFLDYRPALDASKQTITAQFEGMGVYAESATAIELKESAPPPPAYTVAPAGLDDIRRLAPFALVVIALSVWGTYVFVLSQVLGIFRLRERR